MTPAKITIVEGTPEWDAVREAMHQFTENTRDYIEVDCEPGDDPVAEAHYSAAQKVVAIFDAAYARWADV